MVLSLSHNEAETAPLGDAERNALPLENQFIREMESRRDPSPCWTRFLARHEIIRGDTPKFAPCYLPALPRDLGPPRATKDPVHLSSAAQAPSHFALLAGLFSLESPLRAWPGGATFSAFGVARRFYASLPSWPLSQCCVFHPGHFSLFWLENNNEQIIL